MPHALAGRDATILVNGIDASEYLNEFEIERSADDIEVTRFGAVDKEFLAGPHENTVTLSGHLSLDDVSLDQVLDDTFGDAGDQVVTICPKGSIAGEKCYLTPMVQTSEDIDVAADDLAEDEWEFRASSVRRGFVLIGSDIQVSGAMTQGEPVVAPAATSKGCSAHVHLVDVTGAPTGITVLVEGSADGSSWATVIAFDAFTAKGFARKVTSPVAVIPAQLRATVALAGGTAPAAQVAVCVARHKR
jgi:predicted secreted protein